MDNSKEKWIKEGDVFFPISGSATIHETPGDGVFELIKESRSGVNRLGLLKLSDTFDVGFKVYDTGGHSAVNRIYNLWQNDHFKSLKRNLGVIFNGIKGTGKTVSSKLLCNKVGLPTIIINQSFEGDILGFISRLPFEATILVDEAEKTFASEEDSQILLKLIDGVYNKSRKLYILTTNRLSLSDNLIGRPGRIRYIQEFGNLPKETVNEYIEDNLVDITKKDLILEAVDSLEISTIDILRNLIEEANMFGEVSSMLNVPKNALIYDIAVFENYNPDEISVIREIIEENKPKNVGTSEWFMENKRVKKDDNGEELRVEDLFDDGEKTCSITTLSTDSLNLHAGSMTSKGEIVSNSISSDNFIVVKDYYNQVIPVLVLNKRENLSIYKHYIL